MSGISKKLSVVLVIVLSLALLAGCGSGGFAFDALEVNNRDIPEYEVGSEVSLDESDVEMVWTTVNQKDATEEQAKKILADYIQKNEDKGYIEAMVKTGDDKIYMAKYYKDEAAAKASPPEEKIEEFPAVVYGE